MDDNSTNNNALIGAALSEKSTMKKYIYELLAIPKYEKDDGFYSEEFGFVSSERLEELSCIRHKLIAIHAYCTLLEAENFWTNFCSDEFAATWITFPGELSQEAVDYALKYFRNRNFSTVDWSLFHNYLTEMGLIPERFSCSKVFLAFDKLPEELKKSAYEFGLWHPEWKKMFTNYCSENNFSVNELFENDINDVEKLKYCPSCNRISHQSQKRMVKVDGGWKWKCVYCRAENISLNVSPFYERAFTQSERVARMGFTKSQIEAVIQRQKNIKRTLFIGAFVGCSIIVAGAVAMPYASQFYNGIIATLMVLTGVFVTLLLRHDMKLLKRIANEQHFFEGEVKVLIGLPTKENLFYLKKGEDGKYNCTQEHVDFMIAGFTDILGGLSTELELMLRESIVAFYNELSSGKRCINSEKQFVSQYHAFVDSYFHCDISPLIIHILFDFRNEIEGYFPSQQKVPGFKHLITEKNKN